LDDKEKNTQPPAVEEIEARVLKVLGEVVPDEKMPNVTPDALLVEELGLESIDIVSLILALEDEFGGLIKNEEAEQLKTVRDIVTFVRDRHLAPADP
jgi:acyl carrier protein